jgi:heme exporter protein B
VSAPGGSELAVTSSRAAFAAILAKDLRSELRTLQSLPAMAIFAVTTFVIFRFGLDRTQLSGDLASGVLWATLLFAAVLGINRLFVTEREEGGFDAMRLAPIDRNVLFGAKLSALLVYLLALELIAVPVFALFFLDSAGALLPLIAVLVLADIGLAATGTLISSMAVHSRSRDLLVPLILLPLVVPLMIAATGATDPLLALGGPGYERFGTWLMVLGLYDLIFVLLGYAVFDFLLED